MAASHARHMVPGRHQNVFLLWKLGKSEREIAQMLGISKTTVHYWLEKGEPQMRKGTANVRANSTARTSR